MALTGLFYFGVIVASFGEPPTDPQARKTYDHDKEWLSHFPMQFIVTNIRGQGLQYAERRIAALDLVREKRDQSAVPELLGELKNNSFLSGEICDILGEWKIHQAVSTLQDVEKDTKRPKDVRKKARQALAKIAGSAKPGPDRFFYNNSNEK